MRDLLMSVPGAAPNRHPVEAVAGVSDEQMLELVGDVDFVSGVSDIVASLEDPSERPAPTIAYCSPEFGITATVPLYAGGLGVLAGDHLKAASDLGIPIIGVGLFYRYGVFHQVMEHGEQVEVHWPIDPTAVGAVDTGVIVEIPFPGREVSARVWSVAVGGVQLLLLDTNLEANDPEDREITDRLYIGTPGHRLEQEMVLGVGGARALTALGLDIKVHHLNEGHAGFVALELIDRTIEDSDLMAAVDRVRSGVVFTTHTPVPAGIDQFDYEIIGPFLEIWAKRWGIGISELWELGQDPAHSHRFNVAAFCLRISGEANGVSRLHGEVSREMFRGVGIGDQIESVTNGVHARTWTGPHTQAVFDEVLGPSWSEGDQRAWDRVDVIDDDRLTEMRRLGSSRLADLVYATTGHKLDPDALILGFARRFAPYKRATLLFRQTHRLHALLADNERPVHFVFSGKAHPGDDLGRSLVAQIASFADSADARGRFTFLPDYDMAIGSTMVQGADVWLNNPIRPREASGTSGEKVVLNGGLNCSILDGWWAEMFDGQNGWSIASSSEADPEARNDEDSAHLMAAIESIRDEYHDRRPIFYGRVRHAWRTLGPRVTAARMVREYDERFYRPVLER